MHSSLRLLASTRAHTIGFIGVGRMGGHMLNNLICRGLQRAEPGGPATRYIVCDPDDRCVKSVVERQQRENKDVEVVVAKGMSVSLFNEFPFCRQLLRQQTRTK